MRTKLNQLILAGESRNPQGLGASASIYLPAILACILCVMIAGCGSGDSSGGSGDDSSSSSQGDSGQGDSRPGGSGIQTRSLGGSGQSGSGTNSENGGSEEITSNSLFSTESTSYQDAQENNRNLGNLISEGERIERLGPPAVDESKVNSLGIRKIEGKYIDFYTDVRDQEVEEFVQAFDQAVPQWAEYFELEVPTPDEFHVRGNLMQERQRFYQAGLLHDDVPQFLHGYQRGQEFWVIPQPGPYFSRHLVLHEGTHAFMTLMLGGAGPPWYMEGMAELLATHYWQNGQLSLRSTIARKEDAPYWGRVKIVRDAFAENEALELEHIVQYGWTAHLKTEPYGWCWAACAFLDGHPDFRARFRELRNDVDDRTITFSENFINSFGDEWERVREQWQLYVAEMDYGYDVERAAVRYEEVKSIPFGGAKLEIDSSIGWQSTGIQLTAGKTYRVSCDGKFQVARDEQTWWCEPEGVTIHYYRGLPLGRMIGAVVPQKRDATVLTPLATPVSIGQEAMLTPLEDGVLFLRVNESPNQLGDNTGLISVELQEQ